MIRQAKLEDSPALYSLLQQLGYTSKLTQVEQALVSNNKDSNVYVYELSTEVVGFISVIRFFYFPTTQYIIGISCPLGIKTQLG